MVRVSVFRICFQEYSSFPFWARPGSNEPITLCLDNAQMQPLCRELVETRTQLTPQQVHTTPGGVCWRIIWGCSSPKWASSTTAYHPWWAFAYLQRKYTLQLYLLLYLLHQHSFSIILILTQWYQIWQRPWQRYHGIKFVFITATSQGGIHPQALIQKKIRAPVSVIS